MRIWLAVAVRTTASVLSIHWSCDSIVKFLHLFLLLFARSEHIKIARPFTCGRQSVAENSVPNAYSNPDVSPAGIARVRVMQYGETP